MEGNNEASNSSGVGSSSQAGRLPTFKGPRDLTLSRGGLSRSRRTYTPNIPPKRDRGGERSSGTATSAVPGGKTDLEKSNESSASSSKDIAKKGKKRNELVQSTSIFSEGIGNPALAGRRQAGPSSHGNSGVSRKGYMGKSQLAKLIQKTEVEDRNDDDYKDSDEWMGGNFISDLDEGSLNPTSLPLSSYVPEYFAEPVAQEDIATTSSGVKVKSEFPLPPLERTSFAYVLSTAPPKDGTRIFIQLPDHLPVLDQAIAEAHTNSKVESKLTTGIETLPEGCIGKIQVMASGKSRFLLGENVFTIDAGQPVGFLQELASIDLEANKLVCLGPLTNKFLVVPNIEYLLENVL